MSKESLESKLDTYEAVEMAAAEFIGYDRVESVFAAYTVEEVVVLIDDLIKDRSSKAARIKELEKIVDIWRLGGDDG